LEGVKNKMKKKEIKIDKLRKGKTTIFFCDEIGKLPSIINEIKKLKEKNK
jgi:hypothetical protein